MNPDAQVFKPYKQQVKENIIDEYKKRCLKRKRNELVEFIKNRTDERIEKMYIIKEVRDML